ncbi:MAG: hypothetical protein FWG32_01060 [Oscillospiraceae bacterium]|nr:hypothetical protein [Oscillospiraceae bacterium]
MLTIHVKFVVSEFSPGLISGDYNVADGSSVRDLISVCQNRCGVSLTPENTDLLYPLFNGKPVSLDSLLTENGTLHLCPVLVGG